MGDGTVLVRYLGDLDIARSGEHFGSNQTSNASPVTDPASERETGRDFLSRGDSPDGVRVVHEIDGTERTLATDVDVADGLLSQGLGLMFRRSIPDDYALVFPFGRVSKRGLHMLCVPFDIDAVWVVGDEVQAVKRLSAWTGHGRAKADTVIELPAGAADGVEAGDTVRIEGR